MSQRVTILGSTGSIGRQSLEVIAACGMEAAALAANSSVKLMEEQARRFKPAIAALADEKLEAISNMNMVRTIQRSPVWSSWRTTSGSAWTI